MPLAMALLLPHPADKDVNRVQACDKAAAAAGKHLLKAAPGTVVVVQSAPFTPTDAFTSPSADPAAVNVLALDKVSSAGFSFDTDLALIEQLAAHARPAGWAVKRLPQVEFDPATVAALSTTTQLTQAESLPKLVVATLPYRAPSELVDLGLVLGGVAKAASYGVAVVIVANLSSRLGSQGGAAAAAFDQAVQSALKADDLTSIVQYDVAALEGAGEEAARPLGFLRGVLAGAGGELHAKLLAYEAPERVGYAVATWS